MSMRSGQPGINSQEYGCQVAIFLNLCAIAISLNNLLDMLRTEFVLSLYFLVFLAGVNEEDVIVRLTAFLHYEDTCRNACTVEDICRKTDDCVNVVLLFNQELSDCAFGSTTEKHAMRSHTSHCTTIIQVIDHMKNESIVSFRLWSQLARLAEAIIIIELISCRPLC